MTPRENMLALLAGEDYEYVPVWLMGFDHDGVARRLHQEKEFPASLFHNPDAFDYPWEALPGDERRKTLSYNEAVMKPAVVAGWGANMSFGHGGPGEFHFRVAERSGNRRVLECETGSRRIIGMNPYHYRDADYPVKRVGEYASLNLPDPRDRARYAGFADDVRFFRDAGYFTAANLNGFFSAPHYFCMDFQEFLMSFVLDPANTKRLIDLIGEWNISAAEELLQRGVDCITLCDDLGSADNLLIHPHAYRELIKPWHARLAETAHEFGAYVHLHSHGNINAILPDIIETGIDMLNPWDIYESMDLAAYLKESGSNMVPVGGCHKFFFDWEEERQGAYLAGLFAQACGNGRWIFMDTGGVAETVEKSTYDFVLEKLRELSYAAPARRGGKAT